LGSLSYFMCYIPYNLLYPFFKNRVKGNCFPHEFIIHGPRLDTFIYLENSVIYLFFKFGNINYLFLIMSLYKQSTWSKLCLYMEVDSAHEIKCTSKCYFWL
jgi:hypothetical protein